ncbi:MAG: class I SAM-dependent methyltransferase, partial [Longimicrobiales bacterium]
MSLRCRGECRTCDGALNAFLDLGKQPLANRLPTADEAAAIETYPLTLCRCERCGLAQLREVVSPDLLFADYLYVPSTSTTMREHFDGLARAAAARLDLAFDDLVVDVGSNDGLLLSCFQRRGVRILGVEPAANIARAATAAGIPTAEEFFDVDVAKRLTQQHGRAALVTATNVFAHVDDVRGFMRAAFELLAPDGIFLVEVQSFADTVDALAFDMTNHEHVTYWAT